MKSLFLIVCSIAFCMGQTTAEINKNKTLELKIAEIEMQKTLLEIKKEYATDTEFTSTLDKAQEIWMTFRDSEIRLKYPKREIGFYGSLHNACFITYKTELTLKRINTLKQWLIGGEDGNICNGSITKIKDDEH